MRQFSPLLRFHFHTDSSMAEYKLPTGTAETAIENVTFVKCIQTFCSHKRYTFFYIAYHWPSHMFCFFFAHSIVYRSREILYTLHCLYYYSFIRFTHIWSVLLLFYIWSMEFVSFIFQSFTRCVCVFFFVIFLLCHCNFWVYDVDKTESTMLATSIAKFGFIMCTFLKFDVFFFSY